MKPKWIIVLREDTTCEWEPWPYFHSSLKDAQKKLIKVSLNSTYQYDIWEAKSVVNRMVDDYDVQGPEIVKESTRVSGAGEVYGKPHALEVMLKAAKEENELLRNAIIKNSEVQGVVIDRTTEGEGQ